MKGWLEHCQAKNMWKLKQKRMQTSQQGIKERMHTHHLDNQGL